MTDAKIDIVIPVYNPGKVFKSCTKSILNQTFREWRLILVDDGSTDGSEKLCDEYARMDDRITVIHQKNQGILAARRAGILGCDQTHFVIICDSDDILTKDALKKLYDAAVENNADMVCGNSVRYIKGISIRHRDRPCYDRKRSYSHQEIIDELYVTCFGARNLSIALWANLYSYELINEALMQPIKVRFFYEDVKTMAYILPRAQRLTIIPDIVYRWRIGGGSARFMPSFFDDYLTVYPDMKQLASEWAVPQDTNRLLKKELICMVYSWLRMCRETGHFNDSQFIQEIEKVSNLPEVIDAINLPIEKEKENSLKAMLKDHRYNEILSLVDSDIHKDRFKQAIRRLVIKR